jgi:DNA-binding NtrC family response regulator
MPNKILFIDDEPEMRELVKEALARRDFDVEVCGSAEEALSLVKESRLDVIVTDVNLESTSGLEFCRRVSTTRPDIPVIVVTAFGSMEMAVGAIRAGAYDFITKPIDMDQLSLTLGRAIQLRVLRDEVKRLREQVASPRVFGEIIGNSPPMGRVFDLLDRVSDSEATVLVTGESGTGKELVARALHQRSRRSEGPFVAINCAALPENILESELFGHVRGAFTDAKLAKPGLLVTATGGTLFLDEIGEMTPSTQVKLLRALQERTVRPVGGDQEVPFDARIVAATNRDLETDVAENRFREDLYYRVNVVRVHVPPLRARGNDILLIAQAFIERFAKQSGRAVRGLSSQAAEKLLAYEWPGNVRELQNCVERGVALTQFEQLNVDDLPEKVRDYRATQLVLPTENPAELLSLDELERRYVLRVLRAMNGNKTLTAQVLGLDRRTLYRRLERYGEIQPVRVVPIDHLERAERAG